MIKRNSDLKFEIEYDIGDRNAFMDIEFTKEGIEIGNNIIGWANIFIAYQKLFADHCPYNKEKKDG